MKDTKKLTKRQKAIRKKTFFEDYSADILQKYPTTRFYEHFMKIDISGVEYDFYPGGGSILKVPQNRKPTSEDWKDLEPEAFLDIIKISIKKDFFTEEESLFNEQSGLVGGDFLD